MEQLRGGVFWFSVGQQVEGNCLEVVSEFLEMA
jgi:hypothetical protein